MARVLLEVVLPLVAPFLLFLAYRLLAARGGRSPLARTPWYGLAAAGLALAGASLVAWALTGGDPPGGRYVPAELEGGRIVPGRVEPAAGADGG